MSSVFRAFHAAHVGQSKARSLKRKPPKHLVPDDSSEESDSEDEDADDDMEEVSIPTTPTVSDIKGKGKMRFPGE